MYSKFLSEIACALEEFVDENDAINVLDQSIECFLESIANQLNGNILPKVNSDNQLIRASLLSSIITNNPQLRNIDKLNYLIGMIIEQQGAILARQIDKNLNNIPLEQNDYWYYQSLAFLHYLAGGYRIQAKTIINNLLRASKIFNNLQYNHASRDLQKIFSDQFDYEHEEFFISSEKVTSLLSQIHKTRVANLIDLGLNNEKEWIETKGIEQPEAVKFWKEYIKGLSNRGITTFTHEQINNDFNDWLKLENDLLVVLPTGSGKTILGELKTALTLASGKQVVWLLPMRSLVRQTQREMEKAFSALGIKVQELPVTEDVIPLFANLIKPEPLLAITTPEKFLAQIRANDGGLKNIGLVVIDEAQNLFESRGFAIESCLFSMANKNPHCSFVYLTAMDDKKEKIEVFNKRLKRTSELSVISSNNRPTRCIYGIYTSIGREQQTPQIICYSALTNENSDEFQPLILNLPTENTKKPLDSPKLIKNFIRRSQQSGLRTIIFVHQKRSTETRAKEFSKDIPEIKLPETMLNDLSRIEIETGAQPRFLESYRHGIAPHHSSLPKVEQNFVEKWIQQGVISNVIATPTLAQGVNLPFDISIVTFLQRYENGKSNELTVSEVINMLGRAGRAGMVADGLAIIAQENKENSSNPSKILRKNNRWFFQKENSTNGLIGLSRILINFLSKEYDPENWIYELSGFNFSELLSINIILAKVCLQNQGNESLKTTFSREIEKFPSINDLQEKVGDNQNISDFFAGIVQSILERLIGFHPVLLRIMSLTGLPIEFIQNLFVSYTQNIYANQDVLEYANSVIESSLRQCQSRQWLKNLLRINESSTIQIDDLFKGIGAWQKGDSWAKIAGFMAASFRGNQLHLGHFINNTIPQVSQFWGCLSVLEKEVHGQMSKNFEIVQPLTRNGVDTIEKFVVLKEIGYIDRVLAHMVTPFFELANEDFTIESQNVVRQKLRVLKKSSGILFPKLPIEYSIAMRSLLNDINIH
jgi:superfamily II DNA/RNA helicase